MHLKTANGKQTLALTREEWEAIGKKKGWTKSAAFEMMTPEQVEAEEKADTDKNRSFTASLLRKGKQEYGEFAQLLVDDPLVPQQWKAGLPQVMEQLNQSIDQAAAYFDTPFFQ